MIEEAVCVASGPSLTADDVALVREWREAHVSRYVIVVNTTFRAAPWADELYAMDRKWWKAYIAEVRSVFRGRLSTPLNGVREADHVTHDKGKNSGYGALALAIVRGARRIILLGYDAQHTGGRSHWHGDHPEPLGSAGSVARWPTDFERAARQYAGRVQIINATRETAITCFPRVALEDALCAS